MALAYTDDLRDKVKAEIQNIETALENLKEAENRAETSVIELAAKATFIHNIYNGIENILFQILKSRDIKIVRFPTWHKNLLDAAADNKIVPEELSEKLYEFLAFRHFFVHSYGFMLEETKMNPLTKNIPSVWSDFKAAIKF